MNRDVPKLELGNEGFRKFANEGKARAEGVRAAAAPFPRFPSLPTHLVSSFHRSHIGPGDAKIC